MKQLNEKLKSIISKNPSILTIEEYFIECLLEHKLNKNTYNEWVIDLDSEENAYINLNAMNQPLYQQKQIDFVNEYKDDIKKLDFVLHAYRYEQDQENYEQNVREFNTLIKGNKKYRSLLLQGDWDLDFWNVYLPLNAIKHCLDNNKTLGFYIVEDLGQEDVFVGYNQDELEKILKKNNLSYLDYLKQFKETKHLIDEQTLKR